MNIEWKEPPARKNRKWAPLAETLREKPGQWAYVGRLGVSQAYKYARQFELEIQISERKGTFADIYLRAAEVN